MEKERKQSLNTAIASIDHADCHINLIDTPGAADFRGPTLSALAAVETCAIVVNAHNGIEYGTQRMMHHAKSRGLARVLIVNKIDAQGVNLAAVLAQIQATFGKECLPLNLPAGGGTKVVDCFFNTEGTADFGAVDAAHRALVEQVVEVDPDFVDRYLNDGDIDAAELHAPLEQALVSVRVRRKGPRVS